MTPVLPLVLLAALAGAATLLLEQGGRRGYGWVTGSEFALAGFALGPLGLDLLSHDLLLRARTPVMLGASWLGLGLGLRLRRYALAKSPVRHLVASQVEPVIALLLLRALLEIASQFIGMPLTPTAAWALAAAGGATTRSMMDWVRAQHGACGPLTDGLRTICTLDDLPPLLALAAVFAWLPPHPTLLAQPWERLGAMVALGICLSALVVLIVARQRFRPKLAWLALFGATVLGTGLAQELGVLPIASLCVCGGIVARFSRHADQLEEVIRSTQRPVVQLLLLLGGASVVGGGMVIAAAAGFALLRLVAKGLAGALVAPLIVPRSTPVASLGLGLLGGGGVVYAGAFSAALILPAHVAQPLLAGSVAMVLLGDLVGPKALKILLSRAGELWATPRPAQVPP